MDITFEQIQTSLLSTVWGVVLLGAAGSVFGGLFIYLVKNLCFFLINKIKNHFPKNRLFYSLYRAISLGEKLKNIKKEEHKSYDYLLFVIRTFLSSSVDFILFLLLSLLTAIVAIFFGLERPFLLVTLISITLLSFVAMVKVSLYCLVLVDGVSYQKAKELENSTPKKYKKSQE
jgi:hypothetical protein